jgi:hypothetical protein
MSQTETLPEVSNEELNEAIETLSSLTDGHGDRVKEIGGRMADFIKQHELEVHPNAVTLHLEMDIFRYGVDAVDVRFTQEAERIADRYRGDWDAERVEQNLKQILVDYAEKRREEIDE